jgi:lysophospholipase L1-like esterase
MSAPQSRLHVSILALLVIPIALATRVAAQDAPTTAPTPTLHPALFLIGDSITKTGTPPGDRGPWGMGYEVIPLFDPNKIHVYNEGAGGRSSRAYIDEGLWGKILDRMQPGDFVIAMFAHNDAANSANYPDRTTITGSDDATIQIGVAPNRKTLHTYGWYMQQYVKDAKAKGGTVIICTPVPRNQWEGGKIKRGFDGYAQWAKDAAKTSGAPLIDLNTLSADKLDALGQEKARAYFADTQHTTKIGAKLNAASVIEGIKQFKDLPLAGFLAPATPGAMSDPIVKPMMAMMQAAPANRVTLFNGRDISGWRIYLGDKTVDPAKVWTITDGVIKFDTKASGYMVTEKSYSDYHLHVEWRWPKDAVANSNSGVLVHLNPPDAVWPHCFECQLKTGNAGQVVGMDLDIPDAPMLQNRKRAPKLTDSSEKPLGEWNTYEIHCKADTIEVFINGVRQNKVNKLPVKAGGIALQMEGFPIEFRNVWMEPE